MGFFSSNKNRIAVTARGNKRSYQGQNRRIMQSVVYDNRTGKTKPVTEEIYVTKQQAEAQDLGLTGYSLKYGDILILGDIEHIIPNWKHDIHPDIHNLVSNGVFEGIRADKIGIIYSHKLKKFLTLALNDDYSIYILFKSDQTPNNIDLELLSPFLEIKENANRLLYAIYYNSEILDLCQNPILNFRITEVFRK